MQMVRVATISDFAATTRRTYRLLGRPVALFRRADGTFHALEMSCRHQGADLSAGRTRDGLITCPWHGWRYNTETGACVWGSTAPLRPHACEVRGEDIYVSLRPVSIDPPNPVD
jgi:nitrite reductase/ring-hydroxylating ferredoxin subunit